MTAIPRYLKADQLAKELNLSPDTIRRYARNGMPCRHTNGSVKRGKLFRPDECRAWIAQQVAPTGRPLGSGDSTPRTRSVAVAEKVQPPPVPTEVSPETRALIAAALRYVAVADWFESPGGKVLTGKAEEQAYQMFTTVETELRRAGERVMRQAKARAAIINEVRRQVIGQSEEQGGQQGEERGGEHSEPVESQIDAG